MSWKMFWQIVLLIIIATVVMMSVKMGMYCAKSKYCGKESTIRSAIMRPGVKTPAR